MCGSAAELYISIRTVRSHLDRIRDKTGRPGGPPGAGCGYSYPRRRGRAERGYPGPWPVTACLREPAGQTRGTGSLRTGSRPSCSHAS